ncbi:MAG: DUF1800 family protein [Cyclobacteriaceae bacterium]
MSEFRIKVGQYRHKQELYRKVMPADISAARLQNGSPTARNLDVDAGLAPYTGVFGTNELAHLIKRTQFGCSPEVLNNFSGKSLQDVLIEILVLDPTPSPPVNDYNGVEDLGTDPDIPLGETWITAAFNEDFEGPRNLSLKSWWIRQMAAQKPTIHEKMILFWHNLLPIQVWDIFISKASFQYVDMLRTHALGNFKELIRELTLNPAMLIYLNGAFNNRVAPDENYGRELQELFCIGKGPGSAYAELDVQSAAKVLTGWTIEWETLEFEGTPTSYFEPWLHDTSDKSFSSFYDNKIITGKEEQAGAEELDELLDMIFVNDESAMHLARRLYSFFVYNSISESTEQNVIAPLAQIIRDNDFDVLPALQMLLGSEHFFHLEIIGAQIKNPADFTLGYWKAMDLPMDEPDSPAAFTVQSGLLWQMSQIGMEIGDPPNVAGWPAYYQAPQFDKSWITTDSITNRAVQTDSLIFWGFYVSEDRQINVDLLAFLEQLNRPDDINLMLAEVSQLLLGIPLTQGQIDTLKGILLSGQQNDDYWNTAWILYQQDKNNVEYQNVLLNRLRPAFQQLLQLGEAQLM